MGSKLTTYKIFIYSCRCCMGLGFSPPSLRSCSFSPSSHRSGIDSIDFKHPPGARGPHSSRSPRRCPHCRRRPHRICRTLRVIFHLLPATAAPSFVSRALSPLCVSRGGESCVTKGESYVLRCPGLPRGTTRWYDRGMTLSVKLPSWELPTRSSC
jgi:hypothetical protein